jgi:predicted nucleic acid-binding protein
VKLLRENQDKTYSFCDAVSFVVIKRLHLRRAASYDDHFRQFGGFEVLS